MNNLALNPDNKALIEDLEQKLQYWLNRLDDPFLTGPEHIIRAGQAEEWKIRQEHFHGGFNF